jgi:hypothetical protein
LNGLGVRNNDAGVDFYLVDIDASIKAGNPDIALVEKGVRLAINNRSFF